MLKILVGGGGDSSLLFERSATMDFTERTKKNFSNSVSLEIGLTTWQA